MSESLSGTIERVTFHNPENGFAVLRVQAEGQRGLVTVVGQTPRARRRRVSSRRPARGRRPRARRAVQGRHAAHRAAQHASRASRSTSAPGSSRASARTTPSKIVEVFGERTLRGHRREPVVPQGDQGHRPAAASSRSARAGSSRRPCATSWSSCSRTASAPAGPCASTRPTATRPSRSSRESLSPGRRHLGRRLPDGRRAGPAARHRPRTRRCAPRRPCATSCRKLSQRRPRRLSRRRRHRAARGAADRHRPRRILRRRVERRCVERTELIRETDADADEPWLYLQAAASSPRSASPSACATCATGRIRCRRSTSTRPSAGSSRRWA